MKQIPLQLKPRSTDVTFSLSRMEGDPGCLCSRCLLPIRKDAFAIRFFPESGRYELRYHPQCLGIVDHEPTEDDYNPF